jgi:DNA-binding transcriptional MerR regulator
MLQTEAGLRQIKAFARETGVTVRTLHLYDRVGLLKPAATSEAGYRLYGEAELKRLEQILALRFIGFTLDQIKQLLAGSDRPFSAALAMQREAIARQIERLQSALGAIDEAAKALNDGRADLWQTLPKIIEVFRMENDWQWARKYYSDEAWAKLEELHRETPREAIEQGQRDWAELIAEVEAAASRAIDPAGPEAQALAERWTGLLAQFTRGNADIARSVNRLWSDQTHWPADFKKPWSDAAEAFIMKAKGCKTGE